MKTPVAVGATAVAGTAFVSLLILLVVLLWRGGPGMIEVRSTPTTAQIFLDGELVAEETPFSQEIPTGTHVLVARARGFKDKAYRFELVSGGRAQIDIRMERVSVGSSDGVPEVAAATELQGQYLAFIYAYTKVNGKPPAESDMQRHFEATPGSVHSVVVELHEKGYVSWTPDEPRSVSTLVPAEELPVLR